LVIDEEPRFEAADLKTLVQSNLRIWGTPYGAFVGSILRKFKTVDGRKKMQKLFFPTRDAYEEALEEYEN